MDQLPVPMRAVFAAMAVAIVAGLLAGSAWAGSKDSWPLTINVGTSTVQGSLATVRASADPKSLIGCEVSGVAGAYGGNLVSCWAQDAAGTFLSCWSQNPVMASALGSLNGDSLVRFSFDASGQCTYLTATNLSWAEPKVP
jgi:hypothetical protein